MWWLVLPRTGYFLAHYLISNTTHYITAAVVRKHMVRLDSGGC